MSDEPKSLREELEQYLAGGRPGSPRFENDDGFLEIIARHESRPPPAPAPPKEEEIPWHPDPDQRFIQHLKRTDPDYPEIEKRLFKIAERAGDEWQYGLRHDRDFVEMQYKAMKETLTQEKEVAEAERKEAEAERKKLRVLAEKHPNPDMRDRLRVEYLTRYVK